MNTETTEVLVPPTVTTAGGRTEEFHSEESKLPVKQPNCNTILVAVDFSEFSVAALRYARLLAGGLGATLTLMHVAQPHIYPEDLAAGFTTEEVEKRWIEEETKKMDALRKPVQEGIPETVVIAKGKAWHRIVKMAREWNADLIIMGTHGSSVKHALLGSTAERVVRHAGCPVLVVPLSQTTQRE